MENFDFLNSVLFPYINWIIFLILAFLMLRKPIVNALAAKRQNYTELMQKASLAKEEAEQRNRELKQRLATLDKEVADIRAQAKQEAAQEAQLMLKNAEQLADHLRREARRIAEAEVAAAKADLQREIVEQVKLQTVEQIRNNLDDSAHHRVVKHGVMSLKEVR